MNIDYTGRQVDVTQALRDFTENKLSKLERILGGPLDAHVVLAIEKHRHLAEIQVRSRLGVFSGALETGDLYSSIGEVADKIERQALKQKQKLQDHKHRKSPRDPATAAKIGAAESAAVDTEVTAEPPPRLIHTESYRPRPMTAEDAALELEASGKGVLVFLEASSERICVLHRQDDGTVTLIEPIS